MRDHLEAQGALGAGILAIPFVLIVLPFVTGLLLGTNVSGIAGIVATVIGILLYLSVLLVTSGILRTFITGSWTLTYKNLIGVEAV